MRIKTSELTGAALDWAVAKCECGDDIVEINDPHFYSSDWAQGGLIIEREFIQLQTMCNVQTGAVTWFAEMPPGFVGKGDTPLMAAMRCYVAIKLGGEVEIPEELKGESK